MSPIRSFRTRTQSPRTRPAPLAQLGWRAARCASLLLGLVGVLGPGLASAADAPIPVVVIDPGHGGDDTGGLGLRGVNEKDVVLPIALEVGKALETSGLRVVFTRTDDRFVSLAERTAIANRAHGDLCLSIHANASRNRAATGIDTYFLSSEASSGDALQVALAENAVFRRAAGTSAPDLVGSILGELAVDDKLRRSRHVALALDRAWRGEKRKSRGVKQAPFAVLSGVNMPAVLLELGFLTNPREKKLLVSSEYRALVARAIARTLTELLGEGWFKAGAAAAPERAKPQDAPARSRSSTEPAA